MAAKPCCMEDLKEALRIQGASETTIRLYMVSWSKGTVKQYDVYLEKWTKYCVENRVHPCTPTHMQAMNFFSKLYDEGLAYTTINTARSALSAYVQPIDGKTIGSHPDVCRQLKGVSVDRPPKAKYTTAWDVDIVLTMLKSWHPLDSLTYKQLAYKTVMLLALATAQRTQTLHAFSVDKMIWTDDEVVLQVDIPLKHTKEGQPLDRFHVYKFTDRRLCPFRTLKKYRDVTAPMRKEGMNKLWISLGKEKVQVEKTTVAKWLKETLYEAGISRSFKAHSTRGASVSKADMMKLPAEYILKQARWTNAATFAKYYKRPIYKDKGSTYQSTVLTMSTSTN